jgi:hypothetical protein
MTKFFELVGAVGVCLLGSGFLGGCSAGVDSASEELGSVSQAISMGPVDVVEATYGARCGAPRSNATWSVVDQCDGLSNCPYRVTVANLGDPKRGCDKDFDVRWACGNKGLLSAHVSPEANGQTVTLACQNNVPAAFGLITVKAATFGGNVGQPNGNVTWDVATTCDGFGSCKYDIRTAFLGDPAYGRDKDFMATYTCSNHPTRVRSVFASPEANGKTVTLTCPE